MKDRPLKHIVLFGNNESGKTSLAQALANESFSHQEFTTRSIQKIAFDSGISIIDSPPHSDFNQDNSDINPSILLYVIDSRRNDVESNVAYWLDSTLEYQKENIAKFLIFSRNDLNNPTTSNNQLSKKFDGVYYTSSKTRKGIQQLRSGILDRIKIDDENDEVDPESIEVIIKTMIDDLCRLVAKNPKHLLNIEWRELERMIAQILETLGFNSQLTPSSKDGGKDVIINCSIETKGKTYYVEVKHWKSNRVGDKYISDFIEINAKDKTSGGLFLSSSGFTNQVCSRKSEISQQKIKLGDKNKIVSLCKKYVLSKDNLWLNKTPLPELLFEETL